MVTLSGEIYLLTKFVRGFKTELITVQTTHCKHWHSGVLITFWFNQQIWFSDKQLTELWWHNKEQNVFQLFSCHLKLHNGWKQILKIIAGSLKIGEKVTLVFKIAIKTSTNWSFFGFHFSNIHNNLFHIYLFLWLFNSSELFVPMIKVLLRKLAFKSLHSILLHLYQRPRLRKCFQSTEMIRDVLRMKRVLDKCMPFPPPPSLV